MPGDLRATRRRAGLRGTSWVVVLAVVACLAGLAIASLMVLVMT